MKQKSELRKVDQLLVCNCAGTMDIDGAKLGEALGEAGPLEVHRQLCRRQVASFEQALESGAPLLVACTQEAPLFSEIFEDKGQETAPPSFVNIRERAGWSVAGGAALPKIAALIADARYEAEPTGLMSINSSGQCLVYGRGQAAVDTAAQLSERLNVTLLLVDGEDAVPPHIINVPIHTGRIRRARGSLGGFELFIDAYGPADPSSRKQLEFETLRDGASATCDLLFDMTGNPSLFADGDRRDGYFRVDPNHPAGLAAAMFEISDFVGEFEKPLYVSFDGDVCAHSRSGKIGCRNCLDACPKGAIVSAGDVVAVDAGICGGCGNCSAVCPTGAVSYSYPRRADLIGRMQVLAAAYRGAGGTQGELLFHDETHGTPLISAMARFGRGLPANVIPLGLHSVFEIGHDVIAAAFACGFRRVHFLAPPDQQGDAAALKSQMALAKAFLVGLGFAGERLSLISERDPDAVETALHKGAEDKLEPPEPRMFAAVGGKRDVARLAFASLREVAPEQPDSIMLPAGAPYGRLEIDTDNCTLCLACVSACPAAALNDDSERPRLSFTETACVQCGLCVTTCPESVIKLAPRYNFAAAAMEPVTVKEEEPFECIRCGKAFGTKSTVERIVAKLEGQHSMFQNSGQVDLIRMCDDCRVVAMTEGGDDPFKLGERPKIRTTDDYLIDAEKGDGDTDT